MAQTLSNLAGALKRDYHGPIVESLNNSCAFYRLVEKSVEDTSGETLTAYIPMKYGRNEQGIGARAESAALPSPGHVQTVQQTVALAYNYGCIEFTGQTIQASKKSATAFAKVVDLEVNTMVDGMAVEKNRQILGDGTGCLCMTNGAGAAVTSLVVDTPGTRYVDMGMFLASYPDKTTGAFAAASDIGAVEATGTEVSAVGSSTAITLATSDTWADNRYIYRVGNRGNVMTGLLALLDNVALAGSSTWYGGGAAWNTTTIQGLARATYPHLDVNVVHNSNTNRTLTLGLIQEGFDAADKAAKGKPDLLLTTHEVRRKYIDQVIADRRYVDRFDLDGGWSAVKYTEEGRNVAMVVDRHCPPNSILGCQLDTFVFMRAADHQWMDFDGSMFQRKIDSSGRYDAYEATMFIYENLACKDIRKNFVIRDITE